jgi:hypothetical protein
LIRKSRRKILALLKSCERVDQRCAQINGRETLIKRNQFTHDKSRDGGVQGDREQVSMSMCRVGQECRFKLPSLRVRKFQYVP